MEGEEKFTGLSRRDFLRLGVLTATTTAVGAGGLGQIVDAVAKEYPVPVYRVLGRTGLKVSVVSFGAMLTPEPEVLRVAFDVGINYVDTARRYMGGRNEEIVGRALRGYRNKVYVATKTSPSSNTRKEIIADVETSLSKLQTDYIDIIQLHNLTGGDRAFIPEVREALLALRKQGKVRFFGVTTHTNQAEVLRAIVDDKERFFDVALVAYNFKSPDTLKQAIERAARGGIGIIAMKTQAGGYKTSATGTASPHQAALKWVLQDSNIACAIPGMRDMAMFREDVSVMGMKLTRNDERILERYARAIDPYYCHLCGRCEPTCPNNISISDINRALMYAEGYGDYTLAKATYEELPASSSPLACLTCSHCVARCVKGINVAGKMEKARVLFT